MQNKTYKNVVFILIGILFISIAFFFVACKNKNNQTLNPNNVDIFQEIATYIQQNGKKTTVTSFEGVKEQIYSLKYSNNDDTFDYYPNKDMISIYGYTAASRGIYFALFIPHLTDYSSENFFVNGVMDHFFDYELTVPNTPRGFKESQEAQEGHRTILQYDKYTYEASKKEEVSSSLAKTMTSKLKTFSSYFQDKTSITKIENALLYYFYLPLSISIQVS